MKAGETVEQAIERRLVELAEQFGPITDAQRAAAVPLLVLAPPAVPAPPRRRRSQLLSAVAKPDEAA